MQALLWIYTNGEYDMPHGLQSWGRLFFSSQGIMGAAGEMGSTAFREIFAQSKLY